MPGFAIVWKWRAGSGQALDKLEYGRGVPLGLDLVVDLGQVPLLVDHKGRAAYAHVRFTHELAFTPGTVKFA